MTNTHPPKRAISLEPCAKRIRGIVKDHTIVDTVRARYLYEGAYPPVWYLPIDDFDLSVLSETGHTTYCPFKGTARYWSISVGGQTAENAVWAYPEPEPHAPDLSGLAAIYWDRVDHWLEDDEEVFVHPRDPAVRINIQESQSTVRVEYDGDVLAATDRSLVVYETGQIVRYYLPQTDLLKPVGPSEKHTACAYKGIARYFDIEASCGTIRDAVWGYDGPIGESAALDGFVCFSSEKFDIFIDDQKQENQVPRWHVRQ